MPLFYFYESTNMLKGKKILIGITGSIAAYKIILLIRMLTRAGAEVKVIMTPAARDFVSPLTLSTLTGSPVLSGLASDDSWSNHVMLGRWADLMLIAPLSCNTLSKMANGGCDNLLLATYLSATCPVMIAPAMDEDMWHHPTTRKNLDILSGFGHSIIPVGNGALASGLHGDGRLAEPEQILEALENFFTASDSLSGKKALVTAGPTYERIDPVRFIGNHSSGKMGQAIALELARRGADVVLVCGPVPQQISHPRITTIGVTSAAEMFDAAVRHFNEAEIAVMAAAVADYTPMVTSAEKIKKKDGELTITLTKTRDILGHLGSVKKSGQTLVGFALETTDGVDYAKSKLTAKNADLIVLNSLKDEGAGFGVDTNKVTIFNRKGGAQELPLLSKKETAREIIDAIIRFNHD